MVLDTSALVALLLDEPEAEEMRTAVEEDTTRLVSAATLLFVPDGTKRRRSSSRHGRARRAGANSMR